MKSISIDFKNEMLCIMTKGQQGTQNEPYALKDKKKFCTFIPESFMDRTSYTWNFEDETFSVNQDYDLQPGCIMTSDCFVPEKIIPMPGLSQKWDEFIRLVELEEVNLLDELPPDLKKLLGLD